VLSDLIGRRTRDQIRREASADASSFHVLHVTQPTDGGVAVYVHGLIEDQVNRGWRVSLACPMGLLHEQGRTVGMASVYTWEAARTPGPSVVREVRNLRLLMRTLQPDMIHLHSSKAGLIGRLAAVGRGAPLLFQPHGWSFDAVTGSMRLASRLWEGIGGRMCERIISVSEAERERGLRAGIRARIEVVLSGVPTDVWRPDTSRKPRSAARAELGLPPGPLAVCVGRLCEQKGQDLLLAAWPHIIDRVPSAHLALVGDGTDTDRLEMPVETGVLLAGRQENVSTWLAAADVVVAPSRWEGLSLAVLEAMAAGRPVVATDVDGMREALGAMSGYVVPPGDPMALIAPVVTRLQDTDLAAAEGNVASRRAAELFDVRRTYDMLARLYQDVYQEAYRAAVIGRQRDREGSRQAARA
jgi:glycosyltransferase involved in cell wall biosynthesis